MNESTLSTDVEDRYRRIALKRAIKSGKNIGKAFERLTKRDDNMKNEEIIEAYEQLDELSKALLGSYIKKAEASKAGHLGSMHQSIEKSTTFRNAADDALKGKDLDTAFDAGEKAYGHEKDSMSSFSKSMKRSKGIAKAGSKLTKESQELDEEIKGWKHAGRDLDKMRADRSKLSMPVKLHKLTAKGDESGMHDAAKHFASEEDAQRHVDNMHEMNPGKKFKYNKYVDGKHVGVVTKSTNESQDLDESMSAYKDALDTMKDWYDY